MSIASTIFVACVAQLAVLKRKLNLKTAKRLTTAAFILALLYSSSIVYFLHSGKTDGATAFWSQSKWGVPIQHDGKLNIKSQYSYDLLVSLLNADLIDDVSNLNNYSQLWIVTPTQPFSEEEKETILSWIANGGHLFAVSDHTDLFGHASVLNDLFFSTNVSVGKNVILDQWDSGGIFFSLRSLYHGLSANTFEGVGEPWLFQIGYKERTDYSGRSFFSDNQISDEDNPGFFCIGANFPYYRGLITTFGDSTCFANFALSKPSPQALLLLTASSGKCCLYILTSIFVLVSSFKSPFCRLLLLTPSVLLILFHSCSDNSCVSYDSLSHYKIKGDWRLVEGDYSLLGTVYATAYSMTNSFPLWEGPSSEDKSIEINGHNFLMQIPTERLSPLDDQKSLINRLSSSIDSQDVENLIEANVNFAWAASFWFDEGIGPIREEAMRRVWMQLGIACKQQYNDIKFDVSLPYKIISPICKGRAFEFKMEHLHLRYLSSAKDWVLLGPSTLGKQINETTILVRQIWQTPEFLYGDFVIKFDSMHCSNQ